MHGKTDTLYCTTGPGKLVSTWPYLTNFKSCNELKIQAKQEHDFQFLYDSDDIPTCLHGITCFHSRQESGHMVSS